MIPYELDSFIIEYFTNIYTNSKCNVFKRLFTVMFNLNMVYKNSNNINLDTLQAGILDIIHYEDDTTDNKILMLDNFIKNSLLEYVRYYGIILDAEIKFNEIETFLTAYHTVLTVDTELIEFIQMQLEDMEPIDNVMKLAAILAQYTTISIEKVYDLVIDIDDELFDKLTEYYIDKLTGNSATTSALTLDIVLVLAKADPKFNNCYCVKDVISNGYSSLTIDKLLTDLYTNINKHYDIDMVVYEIVATFYIATDTRDDIAEGVTEKFNIEAVPTINNEAGKMVLNELVQSLSLKIYEARL